MTNKDRSELQAMINTAVNNLRLFVKEEADKSRKEAISSFLKWLGSISIFLPLLGYFGINEIAKGKIDKFIEERGVTASLSKLQGAKDTAKVILKSIEDEYQKARTATDRIAALGSEFPQVVGLLETQVPADYGEEEGKWRYVPYQDNKPLEIPINVESKNNAFLATFIYRSIGSEDSLKLSRIIVRNSKDQPVKTIELSSGNRFGNQFWASGSITISDLAKGKYKVLLEDYDQLRSHKRYAPGRQFIIYKLR